MDKWLDKFQNGGRKPNLQQYKSVPSNDNLTYQKPITSPFLIDPFTGLPASHERAAMLYNVPLSARPPLNITQGNWKPRPNTQQSFHDPYSRIIQQDPESEANIGKRMRKDLITKKLPAGVTAAAAIMAAPVVAPIVSSAMSAPLTIGSTILPYVTPATVIGAGFGLTGANNFANNLQSGYYTNPKISKSEKIFTGLTTGLDMLGTPGAVEAIGSHLITPAYKGALGAGKYLNKEATSYILSNRINNLVKNTDLSKLNNSMPEGLIPRLNLLDKSSVGITSDINELFKNNPEGYNELINHLFNENGDLYLRPIIRFKNTQPHSYVENLTLPSKNETLFKEKMCPPGSECAKTANSVNNYLYKELTGNVFDYNANAHNAWHMEDQMTSHGGRNVTPNIIIGDRILMGNGVDQSTYVPGMMADPRIRHAGVYAGDMLYNDQRIPMVMESGKDSPLFLNPIDYTFTGENSVLESVRPYQHDNSDYLKSLVEKNMRYAYRNKPSVYNSFSNNNNVQNILSNLEGYREEIKNTYDLTNDEFDQLRNSLIGIGAQETKLGTTLPGSIASKAKIQLQDILVNTGLSAPIKQVKGNVGKVLNKLNQSSSELLSYPGSAYIEKEAAILSQNSNRSFEESLAIVKNKYQPKPKFSENTTSPSKGIFRQKFQTDQDILADVNSNNELRNAIGQMSVNYQKVKKLYPEATPSQLIDITTLMWNSPGKAANKELVDFYIFGKNNPNPSKFKFNYIDKTNKYKNRLIENPVNRLGLDNHFDFFNEQGPEIYYKQGGPIITKSNSNNGKVYAKNGGWLDGLSKQNEINSSKLDEYQNGREVNFKDQLYQQNRPIVDNTAAPIVLPGNLFYDKTKVVNGSSAGLNKTQLKNVYKNLKYKAEQEKKQELEDYKAAKLFHNNNPVARLLGTRSAPASTFKPTARELAYGLGAGINEFYDVPGIGIANDFVNPLSLVSKGIISPWMQAPLQAQQSNSYLPYAGAAVSTALTVPMVRPASMVAKTILNPANIYRGALEAGAFLNQGINTTKQFGNKLKNPLTKNIKTKKPIIYEEQIDIPLFDESINEAQKLKNADLQIKKIYENIKNGEGWKYPGVNISKEMYEKALDNLENSVIYRGVGNSKIVPDKISLPASNDPIFAKRPEGNAFYQFQGEGPIGENTIYTPDIKDYIYPYHPYTHRPPNLEAINFAKKDAMKYVTEYYNNYFNQPYYIPIEDFINLSKNKYGGPIITNRGQWDYPGQTTIIPSNKITMTGVNYPVLGVDNTGHTKMMQPGMNYTFPGQYVTEYPMAQNGKEVKKNNIRQAYVDAYNNYNNRTFPSETLPTRQKAFRTINPSSYLDFQNYNRWNRDEQRDVFYDPRSEEAFKFYLGLNKPEDLKYIRKSQYRPTINAIDQNYYAVDPELEQDIFNTYKDKLKLNEILQTDEGKVNTILSGKGGAGVLGNFGVSKGHDEKGDYLSYYDRYDLKDFAQSRTKGVPYSIYNRIYYPKKQYGGQNNNLKNINLNLPVIRHQEMNPLQFNKFLVNDRNQNLFIGGVNPHYQNEDFSVGPYMIGVGNKYFQKFPADMGMSGTYHVNDNFDINMGVGQNNVNAGIKYKFQNGGGKIDLQQHKSVPSNDRLNYQKPVVQDFVYDSNGKLITDSTVARATLRLRTNEQGNISKTVPRSKLKNAYDVAVHPFTSAQQLLANQPVTGRGPQNIYDFSLDAFPAMLAAKQLPQIPGNIERGEYTQAGLNALTALPIFYSATKYIPQTYKINPWAFKPKPTSSFKSEIDWENWVKYKEDFHNNPEIIKHLNDIEEVSKANGTWMKNPNGSPFEGTPEQFVVQQSDNFKKMQGIINNEKNVPRINYHYSDKDFNIFDENFFKQGRFGKGIYTGLNPNLLNKSRIVRGNGLPPTDFTKRYSLYQRSTNPQTSYNDVYDKMAELHKNIQKIYNIPYGKKIYSNKLKNYIKEIDKLHNQSLGINPITKEFDIEHAIHTLKDNYTSLDINHPTNPYYEMVVPFSNYPKSAEGNILFDITNPDIYKAIVPAAIGAGALNQKQQGGVTEYPMMQGGGPLPTKYVTDSNNPNLRAYVDSLNLYNRGEEKLKYWRNNPNATNSELNLMEDKIDRSFPVSSSRDGFGSNMINSTGWGRIGSGPSLRGVPRYKKPVQRVELQRKTFPRMQSLQPQYMQSSPVSMKGQPMQIQPMVFSQQHGIPVYGPGSTIIGYRNDDMKFNPAYQYTGAPNNPFNLQDKELLDNPELLKQYIYNQDSGYHYKTGKQNGGEKEVYWRTKQPMVNDPSMDAISKVLLYRNQDKNFMQRAAGLGYQGSIPTKSIQGQDPNSNNTSTLLMSSGDNKVFPLIIQTAPSQLSYQPDQNKEYIETPTWDIADYFATKGYKRAANDMYDAEYKYGGYVVRRSHDRKGKTHVVTGPDGTKKYFGDPNMGERGNSKYGKEAFYARHKHNLDGNPYFRAYARATWEEGGETIAKKDNRNWLEYLNN